MELISVIVPVYNVDKYLNKCIDSIINQTYKNLEIWLVDDGSTDQSGLICDYYADKDNRVKIIHQKNKGGGAARNIALDRAEGEFITFVDSDDYIAPQMYEYLYNLFDEDIDIVECDFCNVYDDKQELSINYNIEKKLVFSSIEAMEEHILDANFKQSIVNKMYRKRTIGDVRLPVGKKIDDEYFMYHVIGNANKLVHSNQVLYAYRQQNSSVMHSMGAINRLQGIEAKVFRHKYICENYPELTYISLKNLWITCLYLGQLIIRELGVKESKKYINDIKKVFVLYPFISEFKKNLNSKEKIWIILIQISYKKTCIIRNILKIGV